MTATPWVFTADLPEALSRLRVAMAAEGWSAESPDALGPEGEQTVREERADYTD